MIDDLPLIHWTYDASSDRLIVNDAFCKFFGAGEADLRAGRWRELLHPDDADGHIAELLARVGDRQPFHGEARFKRADGEWRWLESWARPRISESGEFCGLVGISTDVTDRKQTETELRLASEERLMLAQDAAALGIHDYDMLTGAMHWDRRVRELWGIGPDEPVTYAMFIAGLHPEDIPKIGSAVNRALNPAGDGRYVAEYRVINPRDGRERWVLATGRVVFERGRAVRLVGTIQDISERKQAEAALRASEERLRESDRRKDEYLAMLGHELRNPLAVIHNATELLVRSCTNDPRIERISEVLGRQSQHMTRLIDGLLEVSRIARGKIQLEAVALELGAVCAEVLADRRPIIANIGLELREELAVEPTWVRADRVRFAQIFDNLLTNALKFTLAPGRITVALERDDGHALLRVSDTGVGIQPDKLEQIFEPFHQEAQGIDRGRGGLGLGLALSKGLVELHGGAIEARSEGLGKGAEFIVRLPLCDAPIDSIDQRDRGAKSATRRILIIEDNSDAAQTLLELLRLHGHEVSAALTASEGLEILRRDHQEVVLCDIGLPGMSGHELARAVRGDAELRGTVLIAVTGYGQPEDHRRSTSAGFDAHLTKPVTLEAIEKVLRGQPE